MNNCPVCEFHLNGDEAKCPQCESDLSIYKKIDNLRELVDIIEQPRKRNKAFYWLSVLIVTNIVSLIFLYFNYIQKNKIEEQKPKVVINIDSASPKEVDSLKKNHKQNGNVFHIIQKGDNLYNLSLKYYKTANMVDNIRIENNLKNNVLTIGDTLIIKVKHE